MSRRKFSGNSKSLNYKPDFNYIPKRAKSRKQKRNTITYNVTEPNSNNEQYYLGDIWIGTTNNVIPNTWTNCKANFVNVDDIDKLVIHFDGTTVVVVITTEVQFLKDLLSVKIFNLRFKTNEENVTALLYITCLPLPKFYNRIGNVLKTVFSLVLNISSEYNEINTVKSSATVEPISDLYKSTMNHRKTTTVVPEINVQHSQLKPTLRPYQRDAICWMIDRERQRQGEEILHPLYEEITLSSGVTIYFDKHTGYVDATKPMTTSLRTGGILADEMGLGKTVEVLSCILINPKPDSSSSLVAVTPTVENITDDEIRPVVERQSKKRKLPMSITKPDEVLVHEAKKIKVPHNWVKSRSNKSSVRVALEAWYENMLCGTKQNVSYDEPSVNCICGNDTENKDCFQCVDCSKIQHGSCLGYKKKYGIYRCPQCWNLQPLIESRATLIVAPLSLRKQWCAEICKHIRGELKVLEYRGHSNLTTIYPTRLTEYDLVITTYNVLQHELRLSENGQVITLRRQPKYSIPGSPLTRIKWWRLCLDEAQTVETPGQMISVMSQKLEAHHRWAVTGTPISRDISDLYGLVDYLQLAPYSEQQTWTNLLYKPYVNGRTEAMHQFLARILWRTAKNDVIQQIDIPNQSVVEHWIEFTAVEQFFYEREHELSSQEFLHKLRNMDLSISLKSLNKSILKRLMAPLLALRQACAHHQAVRGRYLATRKQVNSMEDLLNALIAKNVNECEEHLRIIISSLNGLAGIYLLLQNPAQAVEEYRKVLQMSARFAKEQSNSVGLTVDKLQLIHTMHNLSEVLKVFPLIPPTLHDHTLKDDCDKTEKEYMERFSKQSFTALQDCLKYQNTVRDLQEKFILSPGQWFSDLLDWISANNLFNEYTDRLTTLLENASVLFKYPNERTVLYMLANWDEDIGKLRAQTMDVVNDLFEEGIDSCKISIPIEVVESATDCHLRPQNKKKTKKKCLVCEGNVILKQYECKLFSMTKKDEEVSNTGSWKPAVEEFLLKALLSLGKAKNINEQIVNDGEIHVNILEVLKKEFKELRKLWTYLNQQICAQDELDMCKIRLMLRDKEEHSKQSKADKILKSLSNNLVNKLESIHVLDEHELDYQRALLHGEERTNSAALEKTLGTHKYLETLRKQQNSGQDPDPCPICKNVLVKQWNILSCGHCYCLECIQTLLGQTSGNHILCSVCREKQPIADISFILHTDEKKENTDDIKIKGNFSSKVEAIVKLVIKLKKDDVNVKVLVFSNWVVLLKLLQIVFTTNGVVSEVLLPYNFDKSLEAFKDSSKNVTALLLPISLGSKGLNLIEATHVIFVEPLLNPADELQAIGRIHRIGQTKPTVVHKFLVKNTIEQNIHHATATNADEWDKNKVTLFHIKELFEGAAVVNAQPIYIESDNTETIREYVQV